MPTLSVSANSSGASTPSFSNPGMSFEGRLGSLRRTHTRSHGAGRFCSPASFMIDQEFRAKGGVASGRRHKEGEQDADDLTPAPFPKGRGGKVKMGARQIA